MVFPIQPLAMLALRFGTHPYILVLVPVFALLHVPPRETSLFKSPVLLVRMLCPHYHSSFNGHDWQGTTPTTAPQPCILFPLDTPRVLLAALTVLYLRPASTRTASMKKIVFSLLMRRSSMVTDIMVFGANPTERDRPTLAQSAEEGKFPVLMALMQLSPPPTDLRLVQPPNRQHYGDDCGYVTKPMILLVAFSACWVLVVTKLSIGYKTCFTITRGFYSLKASAWGHPELKTPESFHIVRRPLIIRQVR